MSEIGRGWEYRVYDYGDDRVIKIPRSLPDQACRIVSWSLKRRRLPNWTDAWLQARRKRVLTVRASEILCAMTKNFAKAPDLLGTPEILASGSYTQERVIPISQYVPTHDRAHCRTVLAKYVLLTMKLWSLGFADIGYNIFDNCGVRQDGSLIQMDITSLEQNGVTVEASIERRAWQQWETWPDWGDCGTCSEWLDYAGLRFTLEAFQKTWRTLVLP